ncbi:methylated-DNA--[protein]-cysteine S-methyltransferase [Janibacter massiliensis]|uniref:methylated-DNA--[protein]-cysteine S-methyltransferase n=1 Tax=Janibacter massiliensis TaxID=2058291 RepID=UPI001F31FC97|nr:methylated-DNA--[protein]-cysteine S-methyltransferase [Janibacter massiliensis]
MTDPTPPSPPPLRLPTDRTTGEESVVEARLRRMIAEAEGHPPVLEPVTGAVSYRHLDTPIGRMLLARHPGGPLVASTFAPDASTTERILQRIAERIGPVILHRPRDLDEASTLLEQYLDGHRTDLPVAVDLVLATPFQRSVYAALDGIGYGERATYGALAARLGRPSAGRAVGAALGANPVCVVVPCHRVVASSGSLTGYAGGLAAKEYLLDLEAGADRD